MPSITLRVLAITLILSACSSSRKSTGSAEGIETRLKKHIGYLADDKLEGRRTGTPGEELAMNYIINAFREIGLSPRGTEQFPQAFPVSDGMHIDAITTLSINGKELALNKDYFPLAFSATANINASASMALQEVGVPWFFDLKEVLEENKNNPHFDLPDFIRTNYKGIKERGATAMIFYNTGTIDDKLMFDPKDRSEKLSLPAIYITRDAVKQYLSDRSATMRIALRTGVTEQWRSGHNVVGYIDNHAPTTIILGAHYDHLGYGEDGNSRNTGPVHSIHNGADDNASGTAALIELARKLRSSSLKNNNYLFIAFSGEELGLFGSKYFTDHPTIDLKSVNYMINMDMVGRLNDSTKTLTIGGFGTAAAWSKVIQPGDHQPLTDKTIQGLSIRIDSSGTGPSDHTSFYRKDIPVLFYFTGLHPDYHKPTDDADKINYAGEAVIIEHIYAVIKALDGQPRLQFLKTREAQTTTSARFSVSMGIMPDYTYAGTGVRADGVSDGKPAQKAGLQAGDIIVQLGDKPVNSLEQYMQALGTFKKGDRTTVHFKRGTELKEAIVEF